MRAESSPYVGLAPFEAAHADYFFGRTLDAAVLADNILARRVVVFYGASGVGKSSLLNVGLPKALKTEGVSTRIVSRREWHEPASCVPWLEDVLAEASRAPEYPTIVVLDQFEEYFLYSDPSHVELFARALAAFLARSDFELHLVLALRDDGLHRLDAMRRHLPRLLDATLELHHLDEDSVREAITEPIGVWNRYHQPGILLDSDFADALIAQLRPTGHDGQPVQGSRIELAYLQLALERIWDAEGGTNATQLRTSTLLERLKGINEISRQHVEDVLSKLSEDDRAICATVFDRLVTPSGGKILYATSDLAAIAKVDAKHISQVLAPLASGKSRLLRTVELPGGRHQLGYEILHDILARPILDWRDQRVAKLERARADAEVKARHEVEQDRSRIQRMSRALVALVCLLLVVAGFAGWAAWDSSRQSKIADERKQQALDAEKTARASSARANGLRLVTESQSMLSGLTTGGDERALLQLVAADRLAPSSQSQAALLNVLLSQVQLRKLIATSAPLFAVAYSPDGRRIVSGSADKTLRLWDAVTGQTVGAPFEGHKDRVLSVAFSPDGRVIVSGSADGTLRMWDAATGNAMGPPLEGHEGRVLSVAFSPDGRRIVSGSADSTVRLWDVVTRTAIGAPLRAHKDSVWAVAFSPDGRRIASGGWDTTVRMWDAGTGSSIGTPFAHKSSVLSIAFSPDGRRIVSGSADHTVRLWDVATGTPIGAPLEGHKDNVWGVAFSPDGRLIVSASADKTVRLWATENGQPVGAPIEGHKDGIFGVAFSPDGQRIVSASGDRTLRLWDAATGQTLGTVLRGHKDAVTSVAFSPDGRRLASVSWDKTMKLWDPATGNAIGAPIEGHKSAVSSVSFSPDGRRIVSGAWDATLRLWDAATGQPVGQPLAGHDNVVSTVAFSPDSRQIVSGSADNTLRLWDSATGQPIGPPLKGHKGTVLSAVFSPDGRRIISAGDDHTLRLWNVATGQQIGAALEGHKGSVLSASFSPDGRRIVSGSADGTLRLWDAANGKAIGGPVEGHEKAVSSVAFSRDGQFIVSGSWDGTLRLWDATTARPIGAPLTGHANSVLSVAFSPDGRRIVSGSSDTTIRLWPAPDVFAQELCDKLTRNMSVGEWRTWVSPEIDFAKQCPELPIAAEVPNAGSVVQR